MNKKGIVLSSLVYSLLVFFLLLVVALLAVMWYRQNAINILKKRTLDIYEEEYVAESKLTSHLSINVGASVAYELKNDFYYFTGSNPQNWIEFGQVSLSDSTPLLWRIVKVDNNGIRLVYEGSKNGTLTPIEDGSLSSLSIFDTVDNKWINPATLNSEIIDWYNVDLYIRNKSNYVEDINWCTGGIINTSPLVTVDFISQECIDQTTLGGTFIGESLPLVYSLLTASDYLLTSSDPLCVGPFLTECGNDNYLSKTYSYFTINANAENNNQIWYVKDTGDINLESISTSLKIRPVINIDPNIIWEDGVGSLSNPYQVK